MLRSLYCGPYSFLVEVSLPAEESDKLLCLRLLPMKSVMGSNVGFEEDLPDPIQVRRRLEIRIFLGYILNIAIFAQQLEGCFRPNPLEPVRIEIGTYQDSEVYQLFSR